MDNKEYSIEKISVLTELLKCGVFGEAVCDETLSKLAPQWLLDIYTLSSAHDLSHIVGGALDKNGLLSQGMVASVYMSDIMAANFRYEKLNYDFSEACKILGEEHIQYVPLKGAELHNIYPEKWMRVGYDVDILVHKEDIPKVQQIFKEKLGYDRCGESYHDVRMKSPDGIIFEIHHTLIEEGFAHNANKVLENIWDYVYPLAENSFQYRMTDEMFFFYHIAHIAKHIENGGCGIKQFLDLYVMSKIFKTTPEELLEKSGLKVFAEVVIKLSKVWFEKQEHDEATLLLEKFVIESGAYGNRENHAYIEKSQVGSKVKYVLSKVFPPLSKLKYEFPILEKFKLLFPIFTVIRWFCFIFKKDRKDRVKNFVLTNEASKEKSSEIAELFEKIGL